MTVDDKIRELEKKLEEQKELVEEFDGDLEADKDDEFWSGMAFGKYMVAKAKHAEILDEINKIKKEQGL
jgi:predicted RNase H-like nuclease (RuvC/YqgF family)